ncbi:MAG: methylated-DNA--[protein]-cysteine S-methyltransferase [Methylibium sp.]|uniref:methylated-DNA--[protein]-cysteine S-methyltransferase n=1 Tax=Methylibium sp. TaxID=2067992 RepID=UPI001805FB73|nr:methylated-DNA--[protein]-cysteine S-methyltransferase [Methylibium sp.]MBA3598079.1 methylated-DNA--[protein]-cysteine S-methyltransferase [Methylibium sp.]
MINTSHVAQARTDSPLGGILLAATEHGLAGLWFDGQKHHPGPLSAPTDAAQRWIAQSLNELDAYWHRGSGTGGFSVPLDAQGSAFQRDVWRALGKIGCGCTLSYGALAGQVGRASAVRAVAAAVGRNPLSVIVPCHRVIGAGGALTGYAGGLDRKRALLRLEGVTV